MPHKNMPCVYWQEGDRCAKYTDDKSVSFCVLGPCDGQVPSNGDNLRAMSDEEYAAWIEEVAENGCPPGRIYAGFCRIPEDCIPCWLEWLQAPEGDGGDE